MDKVEIAKLITEIDARQMAVGELVLGFYDKEIAMEVAGKHIDVSNEETKRIISHIREESGRCDVTECMIIASAVYLNILKLVQDGLFRQLANAPEAEIQLSERDFKSLVDSTKLVN